MAYYTGTTTSGADLLTAISNAAVAEGWALNTGVILTKGNVNAQLSEFFGGVGVQIGTGQSAGALTGACASIIGIRTNVSTSSGYVNLAYPATYHIFINTLPDEIVVAVNHTSLYWKWLAFGQSTTIGVSGTGIYCWVQTVNHYNARYAPSFYLYRTTDTYGGNNPCFWTVTLPAPTSYIHLSLDSQDWWSNHGNLYVKTFNPVGDVLKLQPNTWNNESVLARTQLVASRPSGFWSYVAEFPHFRWLRNTYIDDGTVITLGSDDWFVAPISKKDLTAPDGANSTSACHSGTNAFAVRKTA